VSRLYRKHGVDRGWGDLERWTERVRVDQVFQEERNKQNQRKTK
jgi:hypothetical protein